MKKNVLKKIIIFYPSFERGGVEIILLNLIKFFLKKKIEIILISSSIKKDFFKNKLFKSKIVKVTPFALIPDRINKALIASKILIKELKKSNK